jgi:hypothetical protein
VACAAILASALMVPPILNQCPSEMIARAVLEVTADDEVSFDDHGFRADLQVPVDRCAAVVDQSLAVADQRRQIFG